MTDVEVVLKVENSSSDSPHPEPAGNKPTHHDQPATDEPVANIVGDKRQEESRKEEHWSKVSNQSTTFKFFCNTLYLIATI